MGRLQGKVAIITGGGSGMGRATAHRFAEEGASVVITDIDQEAGEKVAAEIGGAVRFERQDVAEEAGWPVVVKSALDAFGKLDILVNNAASALEGTPESSTLEDWRRVLSVNVEGVYLGCRTVIPVMRDGGGVIVNISSRAAQGKTPPQLAAYGASKAAVSQYTKTIAAYCGFKGYNIRCNTILPGAINTPMLQASMNRAPDSKAYADMMAKKSPLGRIGEPEDIANAVLYLASDEASFVSGAELNVDGGVSAT